MKGSVWEAIRVFYLCVGQMVVGDSKMEIPFNIEVKIDE